MMDQEIKTVLIDLIEKAIANNEYDMALETIKVLIAYEAATP